MVAKRGGLGRNLSALLSQSSTDLVQESTPSHRISMLSWSSIQPGKYQPRNDFDEDALQDLANSIKQQGLLQPLVVRKSEYDNYEILAGERRWRACQLAGITEIPVIIKQVDDETAMAIALVENLQREDLNAMEQAKAMFRLTEEFALTHQEVADLLSKSRTSVSNLLRLLTLNDDVKRLLEYGDIDMGHARALLSLDHSQQTEVAKLIIARNLSVREAEQLVKRVKEGRPEPLPVKEIHPVVKTPLQQLAAHLNTKVNLKQSKSGKGALVIHFDNLSDLESVLEQITR